MIYIHTVAYNAAKTLSRTVESVLKQTSGEFRYYICDNGSSDGGKTRKIIEDYAKLDNRIIPFFNEKNGDWNNNMDFLYLPRNLNDFDYFCALDADDEYKPSFIEDVLAFMNEYNLDIAACGSDFIDAETNRICQVRNISNNLILEGSDFGVYFFIYHQFMRTIWGKIFKGKAAYHSVVGRDDPNLPFLVYGGDTYGAMNTFKDASRVGILSKSLHRYYMSSKSTSYVWNKKRISSDQILHNTVINYLMHKVGTICMENYEFILAVYFYSLNDTLNVLFHAQIGVDEKLTGLHDIFTSPQTRELVDFTFVNHQNVNSEKENLFNQVTDWMLSRKKANNTEYAVTAGDIFEALHIVPKKLDGWGNKQIMFFLSKIHDNSKSEEFKQQICNQIVAIASREPLLNGIKAEFLLFFQDIIVDILNKKYAIALEEIEAYVSAEHEIPDGMEMSLVLLGVNLSAKLKYTEYFVFFKKLQILLLLDTEQIQEAGTELSNWDVLMPEDEDFRELRNRINKCTN